MTFGVLRRPADGGEVTFLTDELGELLNGVTLLVFGAVLLWPALDGLTWRIGLYAVASLTVVRMLPVAVAMLGTGARRPTVAFLGWFGPRGLASIVFAVIVVQEADLPHTNTILLTTYATVGLSVLAPRRHGSAARAPLRLVVRVAPARCDAGDGKRSGRRPPLAMRRGRRRRHIDWRTSGGVTGRMQAVPLSLPPPSAPIPRSPAALVRTLQQTERRLDAAIGDWDVSGRRRAPSRCSRSTSSASCGCSRGNLRCAARVTERVPAVKADVAAIGELMQLAHGSPRPSTVRIGTPAPAARLLAWYRAAQRRFGVRWELLAAVNYTESGFGKVRSASGAGAQGPMQFMPATWTAYGLGGDVHDPHDAILGAANLLAATGARHDERARALPLQPLRALRRRGAALRARDRRDPHRFLVYYSRQVYARTANGIRRITGPR